MWFRGLQLVTSGSLFLTFGTVSAWSRHGSSVPQKMLALHAQWHRLEAGKPTQKTVRPSLPNKLAGFISRKNINFTNSWWIFLSQKSLQCGKDFKMHRKVPCFPWGWQQGVLSGAELWLPSCYLTKAVREGLLASCIHQLVMFVLDSSSLCWCLALTALCCLGRHIGSTHCFLLTVPDLVQSRRNSWSTAWGYCSYGSKPTVNMKWGITAQNLRLTCRISHQASPGLWQQASQRNDTGKDSSLLQALVPFLSRVTCFTYIWALQCCLSVNEDTQIAQSSLEITDQASRPAGVSGIIQGSNCTDSSCNKKITTLNSERMIQNNKFLGRNRKAWDFQWSD